MGQVGGGRLPTKLVEEALSGGPSCSPEGDDAGVDGINHDVDDSNPDVPNWHGVSYKHDIEEAEDSGLDECLDLRGALRNFNGDGERIGGLDHEAHFSHLQLRAEVGTADSLDGNWCIESM